MSGEKLTKKRAESILALLPADDREEVEAYINDERKAAADLVRLRASLGRFMAVVVAAVCVVALVLLAWKGIQVQNLENVKMKIEADANRRISVIEKECIDKIVCDCEVPGE